MANKDNAAILNDVTSTDDLTPVEQQAFDKTSRGGVKAAGIAGAIFNHKDDKKGQQDMFKWWFQHVGLSMMFPDTSNNRYGTFCAAAAVLMQHHSKFLEFCEFVRDAKKTPGFTNMEKNLYKALQDPPTLTELAVLALYAEAISHPYMRQIRGHNINMLNLGPLHLRVEQHIQAIIESPDILISPNATFVVGSMDGKQWENPGAVEAILKQAPALPHLEDLLVRFFTDAGETWKRFTIEFTPGGVIDEATDLQKELAWMPATNDVNEGILGSLRQFMRLHPNITLHMFNAQAMYQRNNTQPFMNKYFDEDDYKFLMKMCRELDASGVEKKRQEKVVAYTIAKTKQRREKREKAAKKQADENSRLAKVTLIFDQDVIEGLKGKALQDQLDAFRLFGAPLPKFKRDVKVVADKKRAIQGAIEKYKAGKWVPKVLDNENTDSSQEDREDEEDPDE